jgi:hypothetical protein
MADKEVAELFDITRGHNERISKNEQKLDDHLGDSKHHQGNGKLILWIVGIIVPIIIAAYGWIYGLSGELARAGTSSEQVEKNITVITTNTEKIQALQVSNAEMKTDLTYIKEKQKETNHKLDRILEKME